MRRKQAEQAAGPGGPRPRARAPLRVVLARLSKISWHARALLVEASFWLVLARAAVFVLPFRWIARHLGETMAESPRTAPRDPELARRIGKAVQIASRYAPWRNKCLAEAIAAKAMLRRRGMASTLYLGVHKAGESLAAHAWLRCGDRILTGDEGREHYVEVARFAESG